MQRDRSQSASPQLTSTASPPKNSLSSSADANWSNSSNNTNADKQQVDDDDTNSTTNQPSITANYYLNSNKQSPRNNGDRPSTFSSPPHSENGIHHRRSNTLGAYPQLSVSAPSGGNVNEIHQYHHDDRKKRDSWTSPLNRRKNSQLVLNTGNINIGRRTNSEDFLGSHHQHSMNAVQIHVELILPSPHNNNNNTQQQQQQQEGSMREPINHKYEAQTTIYEVIQSLLHCSSNPSVSSYSHEDFGLYLPPQSSSSSSSSINNNNNNNNSTANTSTSTHNNNNNTTTNTTTNGSESEKPTTILGDFWLDPSRKIADYDEKFLVDNVFELRQRTPGGISSPSRRTSTPIGSPGTTPPLSRTSSVRAFFKLTASKKVKSKAKAPLPSHFLKDPNAKIIINNRQTTNQGIPLNSTNQSSPANPDGMQYSIQFEYTSPYEWSNPDKEGELLKQGSFLKSNYNPRWIVLQRRKLFYFKSQPTREEDSPAGRFLLVDTTRIEESEASKSLKIFGFQIEGILQESSHKKSENSAKYVTIGDKSYVSTNLYFGARSKTECDEWLAALKASIVAHSSSDPNGGLSDSSYSLKRESITVSFNAQTGYIGLSTEWKEVLSSCGITERYFYEHTEEVVDLLKFHYNNAEESQPIISHVPQTFKSREQIGSIDQILNKNEHPDRIYENFQLVGSGTFGEVYLATNIRSRKMVAIKKMLLTPKREPLFISEISVQKSTEHPNVVRLFDAYKVSDYVWVALEFMPNGNLYQILSEFEQSKHMFSEPQIAYVISETLKGLSYIHGMHRIHRDIKSDNILIGGNAEIKLADFGYAIQLSDEDEKRSTICGSPYWMAPEVILGEKYGKEVDIWSLGIMLMELCDLQPPYIMEAPAKALLMIPTKPVPQLKTFDRWSKDLKHFLSICLQKDATLRPQAIELLQHPFLACTCTAQEFKDAVLTKRKKNPKPCIIQ